MPKTSRPGKHGHLTHRPEEWLGRGSVLKFFSACQQHLLPTKSERPYSKTTRAISSAHWSFADIFLTRTRTTHAHTKSFRGTWVDLEHTGVGQKPCCPHGALMPAGGSTTLGTCSLTQSDVFTKQRHSICAVTRLNGNFKSPAVGSIVCENKLITRRRTQQPDGRKITATINEGSSCIHAVGSTVRK